MSSLIVILAQTTNPSAQPPGWYQFLHGGMFPFVLVMAILWMFVFRTKRTQDKGGTERLKNLKRGDRIQTIGGILGTVVDVRDEEVVIKVDESNNTKVKFTRKAISHVLDEEKAAAR